MDPERLVSLLRQQGIGDERVLAAIREVPRDRFVPEEYREAAWDDRPLPIGYGQTISQPYVVAFMIEALRLAGDEKVLEIGTGCGYQAAVLARVCAEVYTIEIVAALEARARQTLAALGFDNVRTRAGDGYGGWPEAAPFGGIIGAAAAGSVPEPLVHQLEHGARLVLPVGPPDQQQLLVLRRTLDGIAEVEATLPVRFVPMTGEAERR